MSVANDRTRQVPLLLGVFFIAFLLHAGLVTYHWKMPYLAGHEFRQSQTAIITWYIDKENNFSPLYETPVLGKPWVSILLEVPVYEWSVVGLSRVTGWPHFQAARTISLACFYLMLPAVFLLLGRVEESRPRRLFVLGLVLCCPVYIYYTRAFLMESMELMCCAWFLLGFWRTMERRSFAWLALTIFAGTGAALIKSATWAVWLLPAAAAGAAMLWRDLRAGDGWRRPLRTLLWGLATVAIPLGSLQWWIRLTDPIKAAHASAWIFTSHNLSMGNWGLFSFSQIVSAELWRTLLARWSEAIMPPWVILSMLTVGLLALPAARSRILALAGIFFGAQFLFPNAYAYQDYYYYACALFLLAGMGVLLLAMLDSRLPRWAAWLLLALPFFAEVATYWQGYRLTQAAVYDGRRAFTDAIKEVTPPGSVIVVAGADWAAMTPYYSERRALMVRNGLEFDPKYLDRAFRDLADEDVSALVVAGPVRTYRPFLDQAMAALDLERNPTFTHPQADVYLRRLYVRGAQTKMGTSQKYGELTVLHSQEGRQQMAIPPAAARTAFPMVSPAPFRCDFTFGVDITEAEGDSVISAHPDSDLWLRPAPGATTIHWSYGIFKGAYEKEGDKTNGVEFIVEAETAEGGSRRIYYRLLDPAARAADRGRQHETISFQPGPGEVLHFSTRDNGSAAFDWAYWVKLEVK